MTNLEIKTTNRNKGANPIYKQNLDSVCVFLKHSEDRILIDQKKECIEIQIVKNGSVLFIGDKYELFEILDNIKNQKPC